MQRVSSGYTIIEVIIFLAVSGFILVTSITFLSGRVASNRFAQSMRDIQSKVQDWINDVPTGFAGGTGGISGQYHCKATPGNIKIDSGSANPMNPNENNGGCIFLGKAIQFTDENGPPSADQETLVYTYSVFGRRTITPPGEDERLVGNLIEANSFAAVGVPGYSGSADLTETYKLAGGARVKNITSSSGLIDSHLAGFYLSFNSTSVKSNGSADIRAYQYPISGNRLPGNFSNSQDAVDYCLSLDIGDGIDCKTETGGATDDTWPPSLTDWEICFDNVGNDETALLTIASSNGQGVTTKLEFKNC